MGEVKNYPFERLHHLGEAKFNPAVVTVLEKALEYCRENYVVGTIIGVLETGDRLTVWRDETLPVYETLGLVEYIKKHVVDDIGVLEDISSGPRDGAA